MPRKKKTVPDLARYFFEIYMHADLCQEWSGWRFRGRWLISPAGDRITPRRLAGILFVEQGRAKLQKRVCQGVAADPLDLFRGRARTSLEDASTR